MFYTCTIQYSDSNGQIFLLKIKFQGGIKTECANKNLTGRDMNSDKPNDRSVQGKNTAMQRTLTNGPEKKILLVLLNSKYFLYNRLLDFFWQYLAQQLHKQLVLLFILIAYVQ